MATTTNLTNLKINYLTEEQYQTEVSNNRINENEIYMTPASEVSAGAGSLTDLGVTATAQELNYLKGATSNIQSQLNGKLSTSGTAASATVLATGRTFITNLASTSSATFNGSANATLGVTGTLPITQGGTGSTSASAARTAIGAASQTEFVNLQNQVNTLLASIVSVHSGSGNPSNSLGENGDIYLTV